MPTTLPTPRGVPDAPRAERLPDGTVLVGLSAARCEGGEWLDLWQRATEASLPRVVVVRDLDEDDLEDIAAEVQQLVGEDSAVVVRYLPLAADDGSFGGVLDLATSTLHVFGGERGVADVTLPCDPEHLLLTEDARSDLMTLLATRSPDDHVLEQFIAHGTFDVAHEYDRAVSDGQVCPVYPEQAHQQLARLLGVLRTR